MDKELKHKKDRVVEDINAVKQGNKKSSCKADTDINLQESVQGNDLDNKTEIDDLKKSNEKMKAQMLLAYAELDNAKKRFEREKEDLLKYSVTKFARDIITIVDNVERAITNIPDKDEYKFLIDGMKMTEKELKSILSKNNIILIKAEIGGEFNPHVHQVMSEEKKEELKDGTIASVLQEGYMIFERVLRPSLINIVKN